MKTNSRTNNRQGSATSRSLRQLRKQIAQTRVNRRGHKQYSGALRQALMSYAESQKARGESYKEIAAALGLPSATLLHWCDESLQRKSSSHPVGFRPVSLRAVEDSGGESTTRRRDAETRGCQPVVVLPDGVRIEGLTTHEVVEFVQRLKCLS